jgi:hypothetical protein
VTGRAGTAAAARVLEVNAVVHGDIEERALQAMFLERHRLGIELDDRFLAVLDECDLGH